MTTYSGKRIHFVGIGGIGMSGIAEILLRAGYTVSGSDMRENAETRRLQNLGATVFVGHRTEHVDQADVLVTSSAIAKANPEVEAAKKRHLPVLARAEMLAELMRKKHSIVVAGAHGKTTTSAMVTTLLTESGYDPTAVIGGRLRSISSNARMGTDNWFVAESDESDGSFLKLLPTVAVITNLDREHLDHYGTFDVLEQAFVDFANRVPFDGRVILCGEDERSARLAPRIERPLTTYGLSKKFDVVADGVQLHSTGSRYRLVQDGTLMAEIELPVTGIHNVLNSLACACVGLHLGLTGDQLARGLKSFGGIDRRLEPKGERNGIRVIDDYAHHPTEIRATLEALQLAAGKGSVRVLFQPHRYSRVKDLWDLFVGAFDQAAEVVVLPIYAASESPLPEVTGERLSAAMEKQKKGHVRFAGTMAEGCRLIVEGARSGDILATLGAGDVTHAGATILEALGKRGVA